METLSNFQIKKMLGKTRFFGGVFALDQFVSFFKRLKFLPKKATYIVNYDNINQNGTHWFCIVIDGKTAYNIDSYGLPPKDEVIKVLKLRGYEVIGNSEQYQSYEQRWCGWYCIYLSQEYAKLKPILDIITKLIPYEFGDNQKFLEYYFR